jgi:hypothetical protein
MATSMKMAVCWAAAPSEVFAARRYTPEDSHLHLPSISLLHYVSTYTLLSTSFSDTINLCCSLGSQINFHTETHGVHLNRVSEKSSHPNIATKRCSMQSSLISAIVNVAQQTTNNEKPLAWVFARNGVFIHLLLRRVAKSCDVMPNHKMQM